VTAAAGQTTLAADDLSGAPVRFYRVRLINP